MTDSSEESEVDLAHVNLDLLTDKNKVNFYRSTFLHTVLIIGKLKTVVGITVKKASTSEDDIEEDTSENDESLSGTLAGIAKPYLMVVDYALMSLSKALFNRGITFHL
mgnify:CR=1 FL=1